MADILSKVNIVSVSKHVVGSLGKSEFLVPQIKIEYDDIPSINISPSSQACGTVVAVAYSPLKRMRDANRRRKKTKRHKSEYHDRSRAATEGQLIKEASGCCSTISSEQMLVECSREQESLAEAVKSDSAMELADSVTYTSDEWEEETDSDTDGDHSDSSDDDDPKSQVDRLIEKGTLMYMDGENSALSSEDESDSSDWDSDITDVSPIMSAVQSPLGLSPVLPRRTFPTSPLAIHDNREIKLDYFHRPILNQDPLDLGNYEKMNPLIPCSNDATNMELLMQAVVELENINIHTSRKNGIKSLPRPHSKALSDPGSNPMFIHPIRDNPHHKHLRKLTRKNMSFSNEEVRKIDRDNQMLLTKIMSVHKRSKSPLQPNVHEKTVHKPIHTSSTAFINRKKEEERIRRDNMIILRKIQDAKPSKILSKGRIFSSSSVS